MSNKRMNRFVEKLLYEAEDMNSITLRIVRTKYLEEIGQDTLSAKERGQLKEIVLAIVNKITQEREEKEDQDESSAKLSESKSDESEEVDLLEEVEITEEAEEDNGDSLYEEEQSASENKKTKKRAREFFASKESPSKKGKRDGRKSERKSPSKRNKPLMDCDASNEEATREMNSEENDKEISKTDSSDTQTEPCEVHLENLSPAKIDKLASLSKHKNVEESPSTKTRASVVIGDGEDAAEIVKNEDENSLHEDSPAKKKKELESRRKPCSQWRKALIDSDASDYEEEASEDMKSEEEDKEIFKAKSCEVNLESLTPEKIDKLTSPSKKNIEKCEENSPLNDINCSFSEDEQISAEEEKEEEGSLHEGSPLKKRIKRNVQKLARRKRKRKPLLASDNEEETVEIAGSEDEGSFHESSFSMKKKKSVGKRSPKKMKDLSDSEASKDVDDVTEEAKSENKEKSKSEAICIDILKARSCSVNIKRLSAAEIDELSAQERKFSLSSSSDSESDLSDLRMKKNPSVIKEKKKPKKPRKGNSTSSSSSDAESDLPNPRMKKKPSKIEERKKLQKQNSTSSSSSDAESDLPNPRMKKKPSKIEERKKVQKRYLSSSSSSDTESDSSRGVKKEQYLIKEKKTTVKRRKMESEEHDLAPKEVTKESKPNNNSSSSESDPDTEDQNTNQSHKSQSVNTSEDKHLKRLKMISKACGICPIGHYHQFLFSNCRTTKDRIQVYKKLLLKAGMKGRPSMAKVEIVKLRREAEQLNTENIISSGGRSRRSRNNGNSPKKTTPFTKRYPNLKGIITSDEESD